MTIVTGNELTAEGAQAVADIIKANTTITELSLSTELIDAPKAAIHMFIFTSWNSFGPKGAAIIAEALKENTTITELNLS